MKTNRIIWCCCAVSVAAVICLAKDKILLKATPKSAPIVAPATETSAAKKSPEVNRLPVIGHLETRDKVVTIQSGPNGLLYLVKTKDGKILHENLSEEQLKAQAPEIHELIKTSVAGKDGVYMDGRVTVTQPTRRGHADSNKDGAFMDGRLTISK